MKRFRTLLQRHQMKVWLLTVAVGALLLLNIGAAGDVRPEQWEYKTIWFRVNAGDNMNELQQEFTAALNREAVNGWEFVGRCGHVDALEWWTDYVVFRRPR